MSANVTFDGANKLIICNSGTTALSVADMYSYWKQWVLLSDNAKYATAMRTVGGDPTTSGRFLGSTFFLTNGWKIRPQESNHTLTVDGNLFVDGSGDAFVDTIGVYNVRIMMTVTNLIDTVSTGGASSSIDADIASIKSALIDAFTDATLLTEHSLLDRIRSLGWILRNKMVIEDSTGTTTVYKDNGTTEAFRVTALLTDDSTTTIRKRLA